MDDRQIRKFSKIRVPVESQQVLPKPDWLRVRLTSSPKVLEIKNQLRSKKLHSVCEEASCPNLPECFGSGTATFMIMGRLCTRRCAFCDVEHGKPNPLDPEEPRHLAETVLAMQLRYVVITSVDRDDLRDGGASHFCACMHAIRQMTPGVRIEILVPDFRGRMDRALDVFAQECLPDVFNHNIETVPRLYLEARLGSDYQSSLSLLSNFKKRFPGIPTKSGMMLGLGERLDEVRQSLRDLRDHQVDRLTLGQYLSPSLYHMPVVQYIHPSVFQMLAEEAKSMGFAHVSSGPLVRSSYHANVADEQDVLPH